MFGSTFCDSGLNDAIGSCKLISQSHCCGFYDKVQRCVGCSSGKFCSCTPGRAISEPLNDSGTVLADVTSDFCNTLNTAYINMAVNRPRASTRITPHWITIREYIDKVRSVSIDYSIGLTYHSFQFLKCGHFIGLGPQAGL